MAVEFNMHKVKAEPEYPSPKRKVTVKVHRLQESQRHWHTYTHCAPDLLSTLSPVLPPAALHYCLANSLKQIGCTERYLESRLKSNCSHPWPRQRLARLSRTSAATCRNFDGRTVSQTTLNSLRRPQEEATHSPDSTIR